MDAGGIVDLLQVGQHAFSAERASPEHGELQVERGPVKTRQEDPRVGHIQTRLLRKGTLGARHQEHLAQGLQELGEGGHLNPLAWPAKTKT